MDDPNIDIPPYASPRLRSRGVDSATKRMATVAGGLGIAIILLALVWSGVHTGLGPPPVVKPPPGPMRTAPVNPGGLQVPGAHEQIMSGTTASGPPQLAPTPPPPDFAKLDREAKQAKLAQAKPGRLRPLPPQATPAPRNSSQVASLPLPPPVVATPPAPTVAPALPPMYAPTQAASTGPYAVQLAALTSMAKANQAWQTLVARVPDILDSEKPLVVPGVIRGETFYRLRLAGFASASAAATFCARLKSRGVTCYIPKS
ncbi:SPOR domain-containing protein [Acidiphilium iwatense]|uniref:SPOR domain-containing protein n=1 Tax=Acidiphilium iwatense TaxID=768198 RepID=A0ABS9DWL5_9PROT|nr:SPOR domain-containing protein [Acidiphilium iwatense]MCF3947079.1 SPOR domain-containing protein [Acidiphilium iwatense]